MRANTSSINIVLTGTIVPQGVGGSGVVADPAIRKAEYLANIAFYRSIAPVYFLENSTYPLLEDPEFQETPDFHVRKFPPSGNPQRGKGYQEFELLDRWLESEASPPEIWLKVSGRYFVRNTADLLTHYEEHPPKGLIIDQSYRSRMARTFVFMVRTDYYRRRIRGLFNLCDDDKGDWIERVLYRELQTDPLRDYEYFHRQPDVVAVQGTTGQKVETGARGLMIRRWLRSINCMFDRRYLRYSR